MAIEREYVIKYTLDDAAVVRSVTTITTALQALDKVVDSLGGKLKALGSAFNARTLANALEAAARSAGNLERNSDRATTSVGKIGMDLSKLDSAITKMGDLAARAADAAAAAAGAGGAVAGIGGGGGGIGGGGGGGIRGAIGGVLGSVARRTAFAGLRTAFNATQKGAEAQREYHEQAAERFNQYRAELQEIANLRGRPTVDDTMVKEQLAFQRRTGMNADESINLREQFQGAVASGKARGNITDDVANKLEEQAGLFALRYNVNPADAGKLAGLLGEFSPIPSAEVGAQKLAEVGFHLNDLGVGTVSSLVPAMIGLQGSMVDENGGRFANVESLAARFAATTIRSGTAAKGATAIRQANTALRRFDKPDVEGTTGHTLASLGITAEDDYETALKKIAPKITGPDGDLWLMDHGFANQAERRSLIAQAKLIPVVEAQLGGGNKKLAAVRAGAMAANERFLGTDIGQQRQAENEAFELQINRGQQQSTWERAKLRAETRLRQRHETDNPLATMAEELQTFMNFGQRTGREDRIEAEVYNELMRTSGVSEEQMVARFPQLGTIYQGGLAIQRVQYGPEERAKLYSEVSAAYGGNRGGNNPANNQQAAQHLQQAQEALGQAAQALAQTGLLSAPVAPPGFIAGRP